MIVEIHSTVKYGGISYKVLEQDPLRPKMYLIQAGNSNPIWVDSDNFEWTMSERASVELLGGIWHEIPPDASGDTVILDPPLDPKPGANKRVPPKD